MALFKLCRFAAAVLVYLVAVSPAFADAGKVPTFDVPAVAETVAAQQQGDAADDAEIWLNAASPDKSRIFATDKKAGLMVLDVAGKLVEFFPVGRLNNVDLRGKWMVGGEEKVLIAATDRTKLGITFFMLDPKTLAVSHLEGSFIAAGLGDPYGMCLYRSRKDDRLYAFAIGKDGEVRQFALKPTATGAVEGSLVRVFQVGSISEGCVVDDRTGALYVAEEMKGIWRYNAEADGQAERQMIAAVDGVELVADIEGLTLAPYGENGGYLIASVQGNSTFAVLSLPENKLLARFRVVANAEKDIDIVTGTDGVALTVGNFGAGLRDGLLIVQDDDNPGAAQNFKLVSWTDVLAKVRAGQ